MPDMTQFCARTSRPAEKWGARSVVDLQERWPSAKNPSSSQPMRARTARLSRRWALPKVKSGVDQERFAGHVAGGVRKEEQGRVGDIFRFRRCVQRRRLGDVLAYPLRDLLAERVGEPSRIDE